MTKCFRGRLSLRQLQTQSVATAEALAPSLPHLPQHILHLLVKIGTPALLDEWGTVFLFATVINIRF